MEDKSEINTDQKFIVEYEKEFYDVKNFIHKHPGGLNILQHQNNKNIDFNFNSTNHSLGAKYLLNEYKLRPDSENKESLEHLIDWNKGMACQVSKLGKTYYEWVNLPVDRKVRLFDNDLLEIFTKNPWYFAFLFWTPVITYFIVNESSTFHTSFEMYLSTIFWVGIGIFIWTIYEYFVHRYVFHLDVLRFPRLITFHFLFHGIHHKSPFDEYRLVFPPFIAVLILVILYQPIRGLYFCGLVSHPRLVLSGGLIGFLSYDMIHYYLHFASPKNTYFYHLKRYHFKHHFGSHEIGFGVSNTFWDKVFSTEIKLNKLKYLLKWKE